MRPFFKVTIMQLEEKFAQEGHDASFRKLLHEELSHRKTQRAMRLQRRLVEYEKNMVDSRRISSAQSTKHISPPASFERMGRIDPPEVTFSEKPAEDAFTASGSVCVAPTPLVKMVTSMPMQVTPDVTSGSGGVPAENAQGIPQEYLRPKVVAPEAIQPMNLHPQPIINEDRIVSPPQGVINAWIAMEVLSPATFTKPEALVSGERQNVIHFREGVMPWEDGIKRFKKNHRLYYQIILGTVPMTSAMEALLNVYSDERVQRPSVRGDAVLASVIVDKEGCLAGENPIIISSFGWGVPLALTGSLQGLEAWADIEQKLVEGLHNELAEHDGEGNLVPLTHSRMTQGFLWLKDVLGLSDELVNTPTFALANYQWFKVSDAPDPVLLNSFFIKDLSWAKELARQSSLPHLVKQYCGVLSPSKRWNLMQDRAAVRKALAPNGFPSASWPGSGRYPLAPLQQCAVNIALSDLKDKGILAVNGPPGTGKTTLLRDIVAAVITERAKILASYKHPHDAFKHSGEKLKRGSTFLHMYSLDKKLRGFEIVVASSNNKAVENVSEELPVVGAVAEDSFPEGYFSTVSNFLFGDSTWGMVSAVLGNATNCSKFRQKFWWDKDCGMHAYLRQASGSKEIIVDEKGQERIPKIIEHEHPPQDEAAALHAWKKAQVNFQQMLQQVEQRLGDLQAIHQMYGVICDIYDEKAKLKVLVAPFHQRLGELTAKEQTGEAFLVEKQNSFDKSSHNYETIQAQKPWFLKRLFFPSAYRTWLSAYNGAKHLWQTASDELEKARLGYGQIVTDKKDIYSQTQEIEGKLSNISYEYAELKKRYAGLVSQHSGNFVDEVFFAQNHEKRQVSPVWLDAETARLRGDLFEAAMTLHKAFIDGAAKQIRHNMSLLVESYGSKSLGSSGKDALIPDLWSTLFLVVPVVSTTFASVGRLFSGLGQEALGWLLVDEAGQALPQAAVGALLRFRRAVVVGDPLQIEPIVTLPESLTEQICQEFGVEPSLYNPPGASVQTLADKATAYMGSFETLFGTREVGVPLLVHRRCASPMFSVSNAIAYENLMVQAKQPKKSRIVEVLGSSCWVDIVGKGVGKWCPEEGEMALGLLRTLRQNECTPDVYLVTPFVEVQDELRALLASADILEGWVENPREWLYERVGTVHTVQGREAEAVIFILGAPESTHGGARNWAGKSPNLLNVAVTRAKEALYVIGNREAWKTAGVFQTLYTTLK